MVSHRPHKPRGQNFTDLQVLVPFSMSTTVHCFSAFTQITNRDLDIGVDLADDTATLQVESFHVTDNSALVSPAWLYSLQTSARRITVQDVR